MSKALSVILSDELFDILGDGFGLVSRLYHYYDVISCVSFNIRAYLNFEIHKSMSILTSHRCQVNISVKLPIPVHNSTTIHR